MITHFPMLPQRLQLPKSAYSAAQIQQGPSGAYSAILTALPRQIWVNSCLEVFLW